ncbi:NUDIX domain-containing protein [Streptomyces sp. NPDC054784]
MDVIDTWTGRHAAALQAALRMTNESFAAHLGVGVRTVAAWNAQPGLIPRPEMQQVLDTAHEKAPTTAQARFAKLVNPTPAATSTALQVAIAIVTRPGEVLLVCRRDGGDIRWQFPAGIVKPGAQPDAVAVQETHAETGVHSAVTTQIGSRVHPKTGVLAVYFECQYLAGDATNRDPVENMDVTWVPLAALTRFIPTDQIYPPVLATLEAAP